MVRAHDYALHLVRKGRTVSGRKKSQNIFAGRQDGGVQPGETLRALRLDD